MNKNLLKRGTIAAAAAVLALSFTACSVNVNVTKDDSESSSSHNTITPFQSSIDLTHLSSGNYAVGFTAEDVTVTGEQVSVRMTVYDDEVFNLYSGTDGVLNADKVTDIDVSTNELLGSFSLSVGDTIVINGKNVKVKAVGMSGDTVEINGGMEKDGITLSKDEDGFFHVLQSENSYAYIEVGETVVDLPSDFCFYDAQGDGSDAEEYTLSEFAEEGFLDDYTMTPEHTILSVGNEDMNLYYLQDILI